MPGVCAHGHIPIPPAPEVEQMVRKEFIEQVQWPWWRAECSRMKGHQRGCALNCFSGQVGHLRYVSAPEATGRLCHYPHKAEGAYFALGFKRVFKFCWRRKQGLLNLIKEGQRQFQHKIQKQIGQPSLVLPAASPAGWKAQL